VEDAARRALAPIIGRFAIDGPLADAVSWGTGHINDTYLAEYETPAGAVRYIHQRINHTVFKEPEKIMENIQRVTEHLRKKVSAERGDPDRETLNLVRTVDGRTHYRTDTGDYWRTYLFIDGARTYDTVEDVRHVYSAALAFGRFQRSLADLPGGRLHETIPGFHHTARRFKTFQESLRRDVVNRAKDAGEEIKTVLGREADTGILVGLLEAGEIPEHITHNDTKLNNVMIDNETGDGICVIDLDTVMPGLSLYDFGDSVRVGASTAAEDERDLSKVGLDLRLFKQLARGYLDATRDFLTPREVSLLAFSAKLMTFECGMRFLADYLDGDVYYKVHRAGHNLDRARTQLKMVADMEKTMERMEAIISKCAAG
jgi:hypothetical protein